MITKSKHCNARHKVQIFFSIKIIEVDAITFVQAREVLGIVDGTGMMPLVVARDRGLLQSTDAEALGAVVDEVLARCSDQVRQYREGNRKVLGFLVGQCMKASGGAGNPKKFNQLLAQRLG